MFLLFSKLVSHVAKNKIISNQIKSNQIKSNQIKSNLQFFIKLKEFIDFLMILFFFVMTLVQSKSLALEFLSRKCFWHFCTLIASFVTRKFSFIIQILFQSPWHDRCQFRSCGPKNGSGRRTINGPQICDLNFGLSDRWHK